MIVQSIYNTSSLPSQIIEYYLNEDDSTIQQRILQAVEGKFPRWINGEIPEELTKPTEPIFNLPSREED